MKHKFLLPLFLFLLSSCSQTLSTTSATSSLSSPSDDSSTSSLAERTLTLQETGEKFPFFDQYERLSLEGVVVLLDDGSSRQDVTDEVQLIRDEDGQVLSTGSVLDRAGTFPVHFECQGLRTSSFYLAVDSVTHYSTELSTSLDDTRFTLGDTLAKADVAVTADVSYTKSDGRTLRRREDVEEFRLFVDRKEVESYPFSAAGSHLLTITAYGNDGTLLSWSRNIRIMDGDGTAQEYEDDTIPTYIDDTKMTVHIENPSRSSNVDPLGIDPENKGYYTPEEVELAYTIYDYGEKNVYNWKYAPAVREGGVQKTPVLVVPVLVPGATLTSYEERSALETIQQAFFGRSGDMSYESLRSYFVQSSYGQLEFTGLVTDVFRAESDSSFYRSLFSLTYGNFPDLAQECADFAQDQGVDLTTFDSDQDGLIDAMWLVWIGCGYDASTIYWPFSTMNPVSPDPDREVPLVNNIGWCGLDFMEGFSPSNPVDAHVVIHETSHMLGLVDYYSYTDQTYSPMGNVDMMNMNVGDHNAYSKLLLGWRTPYLVYGNDVEITLSSSVTSGDMIVLLDDESTFRANEEGDKVLFNPFDEYLVLDYYTDQGKLAGQEYDAYQTAPIAGRGGRLLHVDNRLFSVDRRTREATLLADSALAFTDAVSDPYKGIDNSFGQYDQNFRLDEEFGEMDEVRLIDQAGRYLSLYTPPDERTLFGEGDSFSLSRYAGQFLSGALDGRESFSTTWTIETIG